MRNNTARRHSHENLFHCRATLAVWAALIVPLFAIIAAPPAAAQGVVADGMAVTVTGPITITTPPGSMPGAGVPALFAINGGSITSSGPITLVPGIFGLGADAGAGSSITIGPSAGSTITTQGGGTDGLRALGAGSRINATDFTVMTSGGFSDGVLAQGGGVILLQNGRVTTAGSNANGLVANVGGQITATNVDVVTTGPTAVALAATNNGQLTITVKL